MKNRETQCCWNFSMKSRVQVFYRVLYTRDLFQPAFLLFSMMKESLWGIPYQSLKNSAGTKISENVSRLLHSGSRNTHVHRKERRLVKGEQDLSKLVQWNKRFVIFFKFQFRMHSKAYGLFCRFLFDSEPRSFPVLTWKMICSQTQLCHMRCI